ncbi:MAG TPA: hypothetical protein VHV09_25685 [Trebonia sp.]|nr:hypothetical protein [Trebonia sp.]
MSVGAIIAIVVVVVIVLAALAIWMTRRSAERRSLGPEYNRLVDEVGTRKANAEYDKRRRRVDGLGIKPLSDERRSLYSTQWVAAQEMFIDNPAESVRSASALVTAVAADRGYEVADSGQLLTDLSVDYGPQLEGYRGALALTDGTGTATEKLRQALLDYRTMFRSLAGISNDSDETTPTTATAVTTGAGAAGDGTVPATTVAAVPAQADEETQADTAAQADAAAQADGAAPEAAEGTGHRVFWRRESREAGVSGSQN